MNITNTFTTKTIPERLTKQAEIHRRCILILNANGKRCVNK